MSVTGTSKNSERSSLIPKDKLIDDYFEIYSEPHRRYQTTFDVPCVVFHLAGYLELTEPRAAAHLLEETFKHWQRRVPRKDHGRTLTSGTTIADAPYQFEDFSAGFFSTFVAHGLRQPRQGAKSEKEALFFEASPINDVASPPLPNTVSSIVARIEIHKGWYSATIFIPVTITRTPRSGASDQGYFSSQILDNSMVLKEWTTPFRRDDEISALGETLNIFYDDLPRWLTSDDAGAPASISKLRQLIRRLNSVKEAAPRRGGQVAPARQDQTTALGDKIFCDFIGLTLSVETVRARGVPAPVFLPDDSNESLANAASLKNTLIYMDRISPALYRSVLQSNGADVVANYIRRGSAIYISNVGAQSTPDTKDPLRFLILYPDGREYHRKGSPALENRKWWLSRLIHRLLLAGTMRVKALHNLQTLLSGAERLRAAEEEIEKLENYRGKSPKNDYEKLEAILRSLGDRRNAPRKPGDGVLTLSAESRLAYQMMSRHLDDLEIVRIPGWQSYTAFVNRRLAGTYEKISDISARYDRIWNLIRARTDAIEAKLQVNLQNLGTAIAIVGLPATLAPIVSPFVEKIMDMQLIFRFRPIAMNDAFGGELRVLQNQFSVFLLLTVFAYLAYKIHQSISRRNNDSSRLW